MTQILGSVPPPFTTISENLTGRASGTVYQNTGTTTMFVMVSGTHNTGTPEISVEVGINNPPNNVVNHVKHYSDKYCAVSFIVPSGYYYEVTHNIPTNRLWVELT